MKATNQSLASGTAKWMAAVATLMLTLFALMTPVTGSSARENAPIGPASQTRVSQHKCGNVIFAPDPYGAGGEVVSSRNIGCAAARRLARNCGKKGKKPHGWDAVLNQTGATYFYLQKGNRYDVAHFRWVEVFLAGGYPPKLNKCLKNA